MEVSLSTGLTSDLSPSSVINLWMPEIDCYRLFGLVRLLVLFSRLDYRIFLFSIAQCIDCACLVLNCIYLEKAVPSKMNKANCKKGIQFPLQIPYKDLFTPFLVVVYCNFKLNQ